MESGQKLYDSDESSWTPDELQSWESEESAYRSNGSGSKAVTSDKGESRDRQLPAVEARLLRKADMGELSLQEQRQLIESAGLPARLEPEPEPAEPDHQQMPIMWYARPSWLGAWEVKINPSRHDF